LRVFGSGVVKRGIDGANRVENRRAVVPVVFGEPPEAR
jgi:hypothetical protein